MESTRTLERHCFDGVCHCDWRLTLTRCIESQQLWYIHLSHVICAGLTASLGIGLLVHRLASRNFRFWYFSPAVSGGGYYRLRPVEAVVVFCTLLNILRIINAVYLMFDIAPESMIPRTFMFDIPWQFGYGGLLIYVINIAQSVAHSRNLGTEWLPSTPFAIDIFGLSLFVILFVVNNTLTITSGAIHNTHLQAAEILQRLIYLSWTLCTSILAIAVIYSGVRLAHILKGRTRIPHSPDVLLKVQNTVVVFATCLFGFAIFLFVYGVLRDPIIANSTGNMILACIWNYWGTICTLFVMLSVTLSPKTIPGLANSKSKDIASSTAREEGATTVEDTRIGGQTTLGAITTRFQNDYDAILYAIRKGRADETGRHSWKKLHAPQGSDASEMELAYHPDKQPISSASRSFHCTIE